MQGKWKCMADKNDTKFSSKREEMEVEKEDVQCSLELEIERLHLHLDVDVDVDVDVVPKKKLLVFDLNGLLIHRANKANTSSFPKDRRPDGVYASYLVYKRPYLEEFMKFCLQRFEVGIWSSAQMQNINGIIGCVLQEFKSQFLFVWGQNECSNYGYKVPGHKWKPLFFKELSKIWLKSGDNDPQSQFWFSASNTLLIDNDPYKALLNPPNTGIFLEDYDAKDTNDNALELKRDLCVFLEGLADANDVPSFLESHPIGQPALGPHHPDWDFYSTICRRHLQQWIPQ